MPDLDPARVRWLELRPQYESLGRYMSDLLRRDLRKAGILPNVSSRAKTVDSFLKKIVRKGYTDPFEEMHDKVGVRVVVPFISQLTAANQIIRSQFDVRFFDNKLEGLGHDKFAYQSWHYDVQLKTPLNAAMEQYRGWWVELQLRTESQHVWAEMAHRLLYKSDLEIPERVARRVHVLNAMLELADNEFEGTRDVISSLPGAWSLNVLSGLEGIYYELTGRPFDRELSLEVLEHLIPISSSEPSLVLEEIRDWLNAHREEVESVMKQYETAPDRLLFLFQPEVFLILRLMEKDWFGLRDHWNTRFPDDELRNLAKAFGRPT